MDVASGQMMRVSSAVDVGQGLTVSGERGVVTASITAVVFDIDAALVLTRAIHGVPRQLTVILYIYIYAPYSSFSTLITHVHGVRTKYLSYAYLVH